MRKLFYLFGLTILVQFAQGAAISFDGGGDGTTWSDAANWSTDVVPGSGDDVTIPNNFDVFLDSDEGTINSLTMTGGTSGASSFSTADGAKLIITNAIVIGLKVTWNLEDADISAGSLTINSTTGTVSQQNARKSYIYMYNLASSSILNVTGLVNIGTRQTIDLTDGAELICGGVNAPGTLSVLNVNAGSILDIKGTLDITGIAYNLDIASSTVKYSGTSTQNILDTDYNILEFSGAGLKEIENASAVTLNAGSTNINVNGSLTKTGMGVFNFGTSTIEYSSTLPQSLPSGITYYNLVLSSSTTVTLLGDLTISNNLIMSGGSFLQMGANNLIISGKLTIGVGCEIEKSGGDLILNGNFENNGTYTTTGGKLIFAGSSNAIFSGTSAITSMQCEISKTGSASVTLSNTLNIGEGGTFTITNGTSVVNAAGNLVLNADEFNPSLYAVVPAIPAGSVINGNATMEMFLSITDRSWRHMSNAVQSVPVSQWQDDFIVTGSFTGSQTISGSSNLTSIYSYTESVTGALDNGWVKFPNSANSETFATGKGYRAFIRDGIGSGDFSSKMLDVTGVLNQGTIPVSLSYTNTGVSANDGWNFIGNPYPCSITWSSLTSDTDLSDPIAYVFDANSKTYSSVTTGSIAPFQAFFVQSDNSGDGQLNFTESMKVTTQVSNQRAAAIENKIDITLVDSETELDLNSISTSVVIDKSSTSEFDRGLDASYLPRNFAGIIDKTEEKKLADIATVSSEGRKLRKNAIPESIVEQEYDLFIDYSYAKDYALKLNAINYTYNQPITLIDHYTNVEKVFNTTLNYSFVADAAIPASRASDRFSIRIGAKPTGMLDLENNSGINVYPNPAKEKVNVTTSTLFGEVEIEITDLVGNSMDKRINQGVSSAIQESFDVSKYTSGMYIVKVKNNANVSTSKFLVK